MLDNYLAKNPDPNLTYLNETLVALKNHMDFPCMLENHTPLFFWLTYGSTKSGKLKRQFNTSSSKLAGSQVQLVNTYLPKLCRDTSSIQKPSQAWACQTWVGSRKCQVLRSVSNHGCQYFFSFVNLLCHLHWPEPRWITNMTSNPQINDTDVHRRKGKLSTTDHIRSICAN